MRTRKAVNAPTVDCRDLVPTGVVALDTAGWEHSSARGGQIDQAATYCPQRTVRFQRARRCPEASYCRSGPGRCRSGSAHDGGARSRPHRPGADGSPSRARPRALGLGTRGHLAVFPEPTGSPGRRGAQAGAKMQSATPEAGSVWIVFDAGADLYRYQYRSPGTCSSCAGSVPGLEVLAGGWAARPPRSDSGVIRAATLPGPKQRLQRRVAA
jgi:hypothetical protein